MFPKITLLEPLASGCLTRPSVLVFPEVELPLKKDGFTSESTTLEALLRGEGVEKKVDAREEESIQEIQVPCLGHGSPPEPTSSPGASLPSRAGLHLCPEVLGHHYQEAYSFF